MSTQAKNLLPNASFELDFGDHVCTNSQRHPRNSGQAQRLALDQRPIDPSQSRVRPGR